ILENDFQVQPVLVPNRDLHSEEVIAYELGYRAQATDRLSFDTALFYNTYDRLSIFGPVTPGSVFPLEFMNGMTGETYGAELAATWKPFDWWKLSGAYSYLKLNLHANRNLAPGFQDTAEATEKQSPQNHFYIRSSFDLTAHFQLDLILRYVDNLPSVTPRPTGGLLSALPPRFFSASFCFWVFTRKPSTRNTTSRLLFFSTSCSLSNGRASPTPAARLRLGFWGTIHLAGRWKARCRASPWAAGGS